MRRLTLPLCATTILLLHAFGTTAAVAGVSITTPAESLLARSSREPGSQPTISPNASPGRSTLLSVGATVIPVAVGVALQGSDVERNVLAASLIGGGIVIGPAVGYFESGLVGRGVAGIAWRVGVAGLGLAGAFGAYNGGGDIGDFAGPAMVFLGGCAITTGLAVYDCAAVHGDVAKARRASVSIAPAKVGGAPGVGISVRF